MKIEISGINYQIDDYTRDLIADKAAGPLNKLITSFNQDLKTAKFKIEKRTRWGYKVKMHLLLAGQELFAEATAEELTSAIVEVREAMESQIKKMMGKLRSRTQNSV